ncbi:MAG: filamentous hemagglutinin N-terminal domain-containing protein [Scytonema sp. RU_4_4]|nr:filamentous hemagglutinin N-terminal domain-containing protein [Scytonema sp. RU_4_4]
MLLSMKQARHPLFFLALPLATIATLAPLTTAIAQVSADGTVSTTVTSPDSKNFNINDGTTRGTNLFHSFKEFSVPTGGSANFNNATNIQNIISRVTGGSVSNIDGLIKALGNANLFLLNPAGIVFGPNAQLNIGGSFLGSTANSFIFDNGFEFSATDLQAPPLLTINIPNGLRFRDNPGSITNQSNQSTAVDSSGNPVGLQVPSGNSLVLVGGDINSDGGRLTALGGRVELGGLAGAGTVGLDVTGNTFKLNFSSDSSLSNITLANDARVSVRGNGGGDIAVNTNNFSATNGGRLVAGTEGEGNAGDITVNANNFNISGVGQSGVEAGVFNQTLDGASGNAGNIFINTKSFNGSSGAGVTNNVLTGATGDGGNINITTGSFSLTDGAQLSASTFGQGNAGNVLVQASDSVELANTATIFSTVQAGGVGNGGNIDIKAASLSLKDGAQLVTSVLGASDTQPAGRGDAGNVTIDVKGNVTIAGLGSAIFSDVETGVIGNGGNISISSGSFSLSDGAQLVTSTFGQGNAGSVSVRASDSVELAGSNTTIFSTVEAGGVGNGGNIDIQAASLSLKDGAQLVTAVREASDSQPAGRGDAGNVTIDVTGDVTIAGVKDGFASAIFSSVETGATGNGGNITISSGSFSLTDGAQLAASTRGQGNAGSVSVRASDSVELVDASILSAVEAGGVGKGGNININAASLSLKDGAQLVTAVRQASDTQPAGRGDAGNVTVDVTGNVTIAGVKDGLPSAIFSSVGTGVVGNGGNISISSGSFSLSDGAQLAASTFGQGNAGNVSVQASDSVELVDANIFSTVEAGGIGNGGNININAASFSLKDGAQLLTSVRQASDTQPAGRGDAGNVTVDVTGFVTIAGVKDGFPSAIFSLLATGATGNGGNITISSGSFSLSDGGRLVASTLGQGNAGNVIVDVTGPVMIAGVKDGLRSAIFSTVEAGGVGNGGNININAASLSLKDGAQLQTLVSQASSTQPAGRGDAGNVTVDVTGPVTIAGIKDEVFSAILSFVGTGATGNGGDITISSDSFSLTDGARLSASTGGQGDAGSVSVRASNSVELVNGDIFSTVTSTGVGNGGNINIKAASVSLKDGAQITASSYGDGAAGDIEVIARSIRLYNGSTISADTVGGQGNINLNARDFVLLRDGSKITTNATGTATGGNIIINTNNLVAFPEENSDITAKSEESFGGRISINTKGGIFGIEYRQQETEFSDITASSALGPQFSGTVQLNTPDINPSQGLFELSETVIDPAQQIAQNPCLRGGGEFIITGRGGFPSNPNKILSSDNVRVDLVKPVASKVNSTSTTQKQSSTSATDKPIVPARGWIFNEKGEVTLVAYDPTKTGPQRSSPTPASCAALR